MLHREQRFGARGVASRTRCPVAMGTPRRLGAGTCLSRRAPLGCPRFIPGKGNGVNPPRTESTRSDRVLSGVTERRKNRETPQV